MSFDPKEFLLFALNHYNLEVVAHEGAQLQLSAGYSIEIEGPELFKLSHAGQVVAPFTNVEELCNFIKMDRQLNEEN